MKKLTKEQVDKKLFDLYGEEFKVIGEYKQYHGKVLVLHTNCQREFECDLPSLIRRGNCKLCAKESRLASRTKTTNQFKQEVYDLTNNEYEVLGKYLGVRRKILMKHTKCGQEYFQKPNDFLNGCRCPHCSTPTKSKYAITVENWLILNEIDYIKEKTFEDCRGKKNKLPFDFYLPKYNILIEVDGEQHFDKNAFNQTEERFYELKQTEEIKNLYCLKNNIKLIRLPYFKHKQYIEILNTIIKVNTEVTTKSKEFVAP